MSKGTGGGIFLTTWKSQSKILVGTLADYELHIQAIPGLKYTTFSFFSMCWCACDWGEG